MTSPKSLKPSERVIYPSSHGGTSHNLEGSYIWVLGKLMSEKVSVPLFKSKRVFTHYVFEDIIFVLCGHS